MCIAAHLERCACHPHMVTYGRVINHSRNKSNLQPRLHSLDGNTDVILFHVSRNIKVGEELLFHYGIQRNSYAGEGAELDWL